jgi:protocatechuate 3,4-dioxygenase beta subunit
MASIIISGRRAFLSSIGAAALFTTKGLFAETLKETPNVTEGPYYPDKMPLDTDNDLLLVNDSITPAVGTVTWLTGRVMTSAGSPVRNAFVEIWQCDANENYRHSSYQDNGRMDPNFQGYGRYLTDSTGRYVFRTIKPVSYYDLRLKLRRAPHIHAAVSQNGKRILTTQLGIRGDHENQGDLVFKGLQPEVLETLLKDFTPVPGSRIGELTTDFDLVLGRAAMEDEDGVLRGGIGGAVFPAEMKRRQR